SDPIPPPAGAGPPPSSEPMPPRTACAAIWSIADSAARLRSSNPRLPRRIAVSSPRSSTFPARANPSTSVASIAPRIASMSLRKPAVLARTSTIRVSISSSMIPLHQRVQLGAAERRPPIPFALSLSKGIEHRRQLRRRGIPELPRPPPEYPRRQPRKPPRRLRKGSQSPTPFVLSLSKDVRLGTVVRQAHHERVFRA